MTAETPESKIAEDTKFILDHCFEEIVDAKNPFFHTLDRTWEHDENNSNTKGVVVKKGKA
jgi:hypothetical protein